ncbi:drug:proton antiporter [Erwinia sp. BNK-24-b]|uniref:drug:proton antiporter n=1 Tax=Erwinia TaxID=551 RepID=UPI001FEDC512|nr:drug:proton antiporter [Erwinia phyllosphaerae]MBV4366672.1 drug:proton antiporter [Erwinia phyllosphaerae]
MISATMTILYVANPVKSARFYADLFHLQHEEAFPTFCQITLPGGFQLGLWSKYTAEPLAPQRQESSGELFITAGSRQEVDDTFIEWGNKLVTMIQKPVALDFGYTFVAIDPDGQRIRVCCLE